MSATQAFVNGRRIATDRAFLAALALGPIAWIGLALAGLPTAAGPPPTVLFITGVLLYPPLEEWVFRGMLQGALLEHPSLARQIGWRAMRLSPANLLTSVVFAASHLLTQAPLQAASILLPSLVFGALRERFDSIVPGVLVHAFYNAGLLWLFAAR